MAFEINQKFDGGMRTDVDPARLDADEADELFNCAISDGVVRIAPRYARIASAGAGTGRGIGYGKYQGVEELIFAADTLNVWRSGFGASLVSVDGSPTLVNDWQFTQFEQYFYGVGRIGLWRKKIGAGVNGTGDLEQILPPDAPPVAPSADPVMPNPQEHALTTASGSVVIAGTSFGTVIKTWLAANKRWSFQFAQADHSGAYTIDIALGATADLSYRDTLTMLLSYPVDFTGVTLQLKQGADYYTAQSWFTESGRVPDEKGTYFRLTNIARENRNAVTGIRLSFNFSYVASATSARYLFIGVPSTYGVWLSIASTSQVGSALPALSSLVYEATYLDSAAGFESSPSAQRVIPAALQEPYGEWRELTAPMTAQSGVDLVRFWRVVTLEDGTQSRFLIGSVGNAGTPTVIDKYPIEEILANEEYRPRSTFPDDLRAICTWKNRLVLADSSGIVYISADGDALAFEAISGAFDPLDPARGRTFYPDDTRSESILALIPQDALYIVTDRSVRVIHGDTPDNYRLYRLSDSEGCVGARGCCAYKSGALAMGTSGRLLYYQLGQEGPEEVSHKLRARKDALGISEAAVATCALAIWPTGEIEVRAGIRYWVLDTEGRWRFGDLAEATHQMLFVAGLPLYWQGSADSALMASGDSYETDDGTEVFWHAVKTYNLPQRSRLMECFIGETAQTVDQANTLLASYPNFTFVGESGATPAYVPRYGRQTVHFKTKFGGGGLREPKPQGSQLVMTISGDRATVLKECRLRMEEMSRAAQK